MSQLADIIEWFTGYSMWDYVTVLFDNIAKVVYLIYTAVASCLDLLQCVMRKLAGLDSYWVNNNGDLTEVAQQDPVLEFIYGMLGIGPNAGTYSALSTVFWSLAIFGVIVLVISTIVAIIKSHYGEDSNKTNPLSYVYTAVKAIFTFAIVPVAVILGIYLSQFMLRTLDNITAGKATEETVRGIYGDQALQNLECDAEGNYTYYDFFGFGPTSTSQTISGMMFKCAAYGANRVRSGQFIQSTLNFYTAGVLGDMNSPSKPTNISNQDWLAYQVDYAFQNNLHVKGHIYANNAYSAAEDVLISIAGVDFFRFAGASPGFSKYNVGLVWYYYYLWNFNFFVGFASIIVSFGLLTSIIIGLMARLIQSAALFLIYPAVLGLSPLDEFGAFKKWRGEFIGYILMAFGSIIGMNIFFLILPYINEFNWFGWNPYVDLPSMIINSLIIIVGLLAVKAFIAFISGLIGGKDAQAEGSGMKKDLADVVTKAGSGAMLAANIGKRFGGGIIRGIGITKGAIDRSRAGKQVEGLNTEIADIEANKDAQYNNALNAVGVRKKNARDEYARGLGDEGYKNLMRDVERRAAAMGIDEGSAEFSQMRNEAEDKYFSGRDADYAKNLEIVKNEGYTNAQLQTKTRRQQLIATNNLNEDGSGAISRAAGQWARGVGGAFLKGLQEGLPDMGINLGKVKGVFNKANNYKYDDKGERTGTYGGFQKAPKEKGVSVRDVGESIADGARRTAGAVGNAFLHPVNTLKSLSSTAWKGAGKFADMHHFEGKEPLALKGPSDEKKTAETLERMEKTNQALLKAIERLNRAK